MKVLIFLLSLVFLPHCAVADTLRLGIANYATQGLHGDLIDASVKELKKVLRQKTIWNSLYTRKKSWKRLSIIIKLTSLFPPVLFIDG